MRLAIFGFLLAFVPSAVLAGPLDVVELKMKAIAARYPKTDGIAQFNRVYLKTTQNVAAAITGGRFSDRVFMTRLTIQFADYYFGALKSHEAQKFDQVPRAWRPLFKQRRNVDGAIKPAQFVIAGMYAHIGRDLPIVLRNLHRATGGDWPARSTDRYADYKLIDRILKETFLELRDDLLTDCDKPLGAVFCSYSDHLGVPTIGLVREKAWIDGHMIVRLEPKSEAAARAYVDSLDRSVEFAAARVLGL